MAAEETTGYEFADGVPLDPVPPGTNLLVTGPGLGPTKRVVHRLLASPDDGVILVTTDDAPADHVRDYEGSGTAFDPARMAVVSCSEAALGAAEPNLRVVSGPNDLTGVGMQWSELYAELLAAGMARVRTGLYSLSTLLVFNEDVRPVFRFMHTVTGRIGSEGGLGVFALDPEAQDRSVLHSLSQLFDGRIEVRDREACEVRLTGVPGQPDGWLPVE